MKSEKHRAFIRTCPCLLCGNEISTEAAHIRYPDLRAGKPLTGRMRPDDCYIIPLCSRCHREQHVGSEQEFWKSYEIDPVKAAMALWIHSGDINAATMIISAWRSGNGGVGAGINQTTSDKVEA